MSGYGITSFFFFFNDTATTEIYTLSLHDALPISFSHSIDDGQSSQTFTSSNNVLNPFDLALEKSSSNFDIRHRFVIGTVWTPHFYQGESRLFKELLNGFTISPLVAASRSEEHTSELQ